MNPKFPKVYLAIAATLLLALTTLGILRFGNSQWNRWIYVFQCYYWPGHSNEYGINYILPPKNYAGVWYDWYQNGELMVSELYLNGHPSSFNYWDKKGNKMIFGLWKNGKAHGAWKYWDTNGQLRGLINHIDGRVLEDSKYYGNNGESVSKLEFERWSKALDTP